MFRGLPDSTCVFFLQICTVSFALAPDWHIVTDTTSSSDLFHSKSTSTQRIVHTDAAMTPEHYSFLEQITSLKDPREVFPAFFLEDLNVTQPPAIENICSGGGALVRQSKYDEDNDFIGELTGSLLEEASAATRMERYHCTSLREVEVLDNDEIRTNTVFSRSFEAEKSLSELVRIIRNELQLEESLKPPDVIKEGCRFFDLEYKGENMKPIAKQLVCMIGAE